MTNVSTSGHHFHIQNRPVTPTKPLYSRGFSRNVDPTLPNLIRLRTPRLGGGLGVRYLWCLQALVAAEIDTLPFET